MSTPDLANHIVEATSVWVTPVGQFDRRHRKRAKRLFVESDAASLHRLRQSLSVDMASFADNIALMTPGDLDMNFLAGHEWLATVTFIYPTVIRWSEWKTDARLASSSGLISWLVDHGWRLPV